MDSRVAYIYLYMHVHRQIPEISPPPATSILTLAPEPLPLYLCTHSSCVQSDQNFSVQTGATEVYIPVQESTSADNIALNRNNLLN